MYYEAEKLQVVRYLCAKIDLVSLYMLADRMTPTTPTCLPCCFEQSMNHISLNRNGQY